MKQENNHASVVINPFVIYIGLAILAIFLQFIIPLSLFQEKTARFIGLILIALNFIFGIPALRGMLLAKTSPNPQRPSTTLILSGIYQVTRNPMYLGLGLVFVGLLVFFQNYWGFVLIPILIWLITIWVIIPEEKYLQEKFGEEYLKYKTRVRRWI